MNRRTVLIGGLSTAALTTLNTRGESVPELQRPPGSSPEAASGRGLRVIDLRCEYAVNPLGLDVLRPRLSWRLVSGIRGQKQTAYQIRAASSAEALHAGHVDLWDSGKVVSDQSIQVPYGGASLASRQRCFWQVQVWDKDGAPTSSTEAAFWEMGLLAADDWSAGWISHTGGWNGRALYFRGEFALSKPVAGARAYVTGLGYHEFRINGKRVGDHKLDPGWTDYSRRVQYVTYDIGNLLRPGQNVFGCVVGNGWYGNPILLLQAEITHTDHSTRRLITGKHGASEISWRVSTGPIISNSIYGGETYDARLEKPGWDLPGKPSYRINDRTEEWTSPMAVSVPGGRLVAESQEPIKVVDSLKPRFKASPAPGVYVFDVGQNMAGWAELHLKGQPGQHIVLKFAETLLSDGAVNQANLRTATATDEYICKGEGEECWAPLFTYHGFRYVQVEGYPGVPGLDDIVIKTVRSSVQPNGRFQCGNPLINQIQAMVWHTEASNLYGVPTDCPQRDERQGWMNDLTVRLEESVYNFHVARFYRKFLDDVADTQDVHGAIADTAPFRFGNKPADPVCASYLLMGWLLYKHYGDTEVLAKHFEGFKAWVDFLMSRTTGYIVDYGYYGDWSPPAAFGNPKGSAVSKDTPRTLMSTGFLYYTSNLISKVATILGRHQEAATYAKNAGKVAEAFNAKYWDEAKGGYGANNQSANAFALYIGLVPPERVAWVVKNLVNDVKDRQYHLTTGNICTKYLIETLTQYGHADVAFRVATQKTYPSWGYMLANGATTLWERWENLVGSGMNSHNHPMMGSVSCWFYKYLAGIDLAEDGAGFKRIMIQPTFLPDLPYVDAEYSTMYGVVRSSWKRTGDRIDLEVAIPTNTQAIVRLPANRKSDITESDRTLDAAEGVRAAQIRDGIAMIQIESGTYHFSV